MKSKRTRTKLAVVKLDPNGVPPARIKSPAAEQVSVDVDIESLGEHLPTRVLHDYLGTWAIFGTAARVMANRINSTSDMLSHIARNTTPESIEAASAEAHKSFETVTASEQTATGGAVARIPIMGTLMKRSSSMDERSMSTVAIRRRIREAADDPSISSIILVIDSPGGTVSGTKDLADDVRRAAEKKTVVAYVEDLAASAAYWIAAACDEIVLNNETALVGSIGTYTVIDDYSKALEDKGIKVHLISTGRYKGLGVPGTEITEEHLAYVQKEVEDLNSVFLNSVSEGRGMALDKLAEIADGRVFQGSEAIKLGLADRVASLDELTGELLNGGGVSAKAMGRYSYSDASAPTQGIRFEGSVEQLTEYAATRQATGPSNFNNGSFADLRMPESSLKEKSMSLELVTLEELQAANPVLVNRIAESTRNGMKAEQEAAIEAAVQAERDRCTAIVKACESYGFGGEMRMLIGEGKSPEQAESRLKDLKIEGLERGARSADDVGPAEDPDEQDEDDPAAPESMDDEDDEGMDAKYAKEWKRDKQARADFGGNFEAFVAYRNAEKKGTVKTTLDLQRR